MNEIAKIESSFKSEIISKLAGKHYDNKLISKDGLIKALLFRGAFNNAFSSLSGVQKRKYEVDSTILFTLTTLTTEGVDVSLRDVQNAFEKNRQFGKEIAYRPPHYNRLNKLIDGFVEWHKSTRLNPIEKAALAHIK